jgi:signal peptidase II
LLSGLVILLDQLSKLAAERWLTPFEPLSILPSLNLTLLYNPGAAFSFLAGAGGWQRWLFVVLALGVSVGLVIWLSRLRPQERLLGAALSLVLGGAVGNLIDRLLYGHVIDFIDLYWRDWHWPAFNIADSAISVGAVLLLADGLFGGRDRAGRS